MRFSLPSRACSSSRASALCSTCCPIVSLSSSILPVRQAEDGIRDLTVTGVQTCALPILVRSTRRPLGFARGAKAALGIARARPDHLPRRLRPPPRRRGAVRPRGCLADPARVADRRVRSEEHTSELQSQSQLVCRLLPALQ